MQKNSKTGKMSKEDKYNNFARGEKYFVSQEKMRNRDPRLYNASFAQACENAVNGMIYCVTTQTNMRKELILGTIVMILSLFYDYSVSEFLCLVFAVFFVIFAELINTSIEAIVDLITEEYHPKAKIAKDVGAGACVLTAINAIIVAYFLFLRETDISKMGTTLFTTLVSSKVHLVFVGIILTVIAVIGIKAAISIRKHQLGKEVKFIPSGQSAVAFAILTAIWINSKDPVTFCLALVLSLIIGNRMYSARKFSEVLFGAFMGALIVMMVYGLIFLKRIES